MKKFIFDIQTGLMTEQDLTAAEIQEREQAEITWKEWQAQQNDSSPETRFKKLEADLEAVNSKMAAVEAKLAKQK